ncbi:alkaline phosphatase D family protein [Robiginitalea sp. M366]|uniref:alkaline phosphatase D family protein n=1 Tax=Robiginitalea aestuariiviva TaxID=3036903 RepID=UPI00240E6FCC|nr:alkaline phosphatase D family protein [Robiginitalea aestuariiviva]MDG1573239.1 alkaline phosphatase D family protein [Robiginitalea aestuariiviva]
MKAFSACLAAFLIAVSCRDPQPAATAPEEPVFTVAFGSCNRTRLPNPLWDDVLQARPQVWIWGGDVVYADTDSIPLLKAAYALQDSVPGYARLREAVPVLGTWDDHDYGMNDGGASFQAREASQQAFLDFLNVAPRDPRRLQPGVYHSETFRHGPYAVKILLLDTRYHRSDLTPDTTGVKRYVPNPDGEGTMLGEAQWAWLGRELKNSRADFNLVVSSIQVLSDRHGFETWGNMPHERQRLLELIAASGARGVILLSGDRHLSEFSRTQVAGLPYPLVDFTSSGLTHVYSGFSGEENPYRVGQVVNERSFGLLRLYPESGRARMEMMGDSSRTLSSLQVRFQ